MKPVFIEIYNEIIAYLQQNLPEKFCYHNINHTLYVLEKATHIAIKEKISPNKLFLLQVAALYHDSGFVIDPSNHEHESCNLARKNLPKHHLNIKEIDEICEIIMVTKLPQSPKNTVEAVLADADLYYLSTKESPNLSIKLYQEWQLNQHDLTPKQWVEISDTFIKNHQFHTNYCKKYRTHLKLKYNFKS
jgi:uncharacterized protein